MERVETKAFPSISDPANAHSRPMFQGRTGGARTMRPRSTCPQGGCACPLAHTLDAFVAAGAIRPGLKFLPDMAGELERDFALAGRRQVHVDQEIRQLRQAPIPIDDL